MAEFTKETITTQGITNQGTQAIDSNKASSFQTLEYLIYFFFGALEILLTFRFAFKLTGANVGTGFVAFIYGLTGIFISPFEGIFRLWFAKGVETTTSIFEPTTLVAIVAYAVLAWVIVKFVRISSGKQLQAE